MLIAGTRNGAALRRTSDGCVGRPIRSITATGIIRMAMLRNQGELTMTEAVSARDWFGELQARGDDPAGFVALALEAWKTGVPEEEICRLAGEVLNNGGGMIAAAIAAAKKAKPKAVAK